MYKSAISSLFTAYPVQYHRGRQHTSYQDEEHQFEQLLAVSSEENSGDKNENHRDQTNKIATIESLILLSPPILRRFIDKQLKWRLINNGQFSGMTIDAIIHTDTLKICLKMRGTPSQQMLFHLSRLEKVLSLKFHRSVTLEVVLDDND